jgi:hypothetical protein
MVQIKPGPLRSFPWAKPINSLFSFASMGYLLSICFGLWPFNIVNVLSFSVHLTFYHWPFNIFFPSFIFKRYSNLIYILLG